MLQRFKAWRANKRLEQTLRPDPDYRTRRLAQFTPERRERYWSNVAETHSENA